MGILLALQFQGNYSTEQHHCSKNYYGDNFCVAVQEELCVSDLSQFWAIAVHVISDSFSCQHEKLPVQCEQIPCICTDVTDLVLELGVVIPKFSCLHHPIIFLLW